MKFEINRDTIERTTKCHCMFNCLKEHENPECCNDKPLCPVIGKSSKDELFVDFNGDYNCSYKFDFLEAGFMCNCPVRFEICRRYNK